MATKQIYVRDEDEQIFEEARSFFGDSLSRIIVESVKKNVESEKMKKEGFETVEIREGAGDDIKVKKVIAKELSFYDPDPFTKGATGILHKILITRKGKFIYEKHYWDRWDNGVDEFELYIKDKLDDFEVPQTAIDEAKENLGEDSAEFLDI